MPGKELQKVVHTDLYSLVRKDEIWDVTAEAFGDFYYAVADSFLQSL